MQEKDGILYKKILDIVTGVVVPDPKIIRVELLDNGPQQDYFSLPYEYFSREDDFITKYFS